MDSTTSSQSAFLPPRSSLSLAETQSTLFLIPFSVAIASAAILSIHISVSRRAQAPGNSDSQSRTTSHPHVSAFGGPVIFGYYIVRLAACLALTAIGVVQLVKEEKENIIFIYLLSVFIYSTVLAFVSLVNPTWSRTFIRHLNTILCTTLAVYLYRDIYPLGTYGLTPQDKPEGPLLWTKISILAVAAVVIPLVVPRKYVPVDPKHPTIPSLEQTCSWLSRLMYSFMDPVIIKALRTPNLPYEDLPPLADYDHAEYLTKRSLQYLDPTIVIKRQHVFYALLKIFARDFTIMALLVMLGSVLSFSSPIGVKYLLGYLETGGVDAFFKPWVFLLWLFVGPLLETIVGESYYYTSMRQAVHAEAILTEAVLEHALRMRLNATDIADKSTLGAPLASTDTVSSLDEPSTLESKGGTSENGDQKTSHSEVDSSGSTLLAGSSTSVSSQTAAPVKDVHDSASASSTARTPEPSPQAKIESKKVNIDNLITSDVQNITSGTDALRLMVQLPLQVTLCVVFLYNVLGWSAFVGLGVIVALFPISGLITKSIQAAQEKKMGKTDARIQMVTETMNVLRMIKTFGWESLMNDRIKNVREEELTYMRRIRYLGIATQTANFTIPIFTMLATYAAYTILMKEALTASKVFSSMIVFDKFSSLMEEVMLFLRITVYSKVSLDRITEFLYNTELLDTFTPGFEAASLTTTTNQDILGFRNATFSWSNHENPSKRNFLLRIEGELVFKRGAINLILGGTGSGKTSILMALLSEMHFLPSGPDSWYNLPRDRGVAYAAQESWVQNATIKENIIFESEFDDERYKKVLYQCALERDLDLFEAGDGTEVGEKGLTLSGGQKARVTLARAIYSNAEVVLLDDVLAALDVHTSKWIVEKCFKGDLIKDRTLVLVTHNIALTQSIAGFVVTMKDGRVDSQATTSEALSKLVAQVETEEFLIEDAETPPLDKADEKNSEESQGKIIVAEEVQVGHVSWPALLLFFKGLGGRHPVLFFSSFIAFTALSELCEILQTWYLGHWASQYELHSNDPSQVNALYYLTGYTLILLFMVLVTCIAFLIYLFGWIRMSRSLHKQLMESILGTTFRWLDTTPTSRVITRCTRDMANIDGNLPGVLHPLTRLAVDLLGQFCSIIYFTPVFFFPGMLLGVVVFLCGSVYTKAQLPIKRIQSNSKAPVLAHFGSVMTGLVSVRAYGIQDSLIKESLQRINYYSRPSGLEWNLSRWLNTRLDILGNLFTVSLAGYLVYVGHREASTTGFSLNMSVLFSSYILYFIRNFSFFQVSANGLERIHAYVEMEQEPKPTQRGIPPAYWPSSGDLRVENLCARYSPDGPNILQNISFHVKSGERIGVVGRTGSGKSSLMLSLLRCIYTDGKVYYDGLETTSLNLNELRSKVTIIPQIPELLSGTVRQNLDPFGNIDDASLNDALRSAGLYSIQSEDDENTLIDLDTNVASGGNNLSVGQRQILALARARLRGSKLLILDEATAAVDYKTDAIIQSSLRREMKGEITIISIAHRLQTVLDADKIMVLDAGKIVEYDSPRELLKNEHGHLRALVNESEDKEQLYRLAEEDSI